MTVLEYMNFVADLKKIPKDKKKSMIEEVMDMVKITDMKNRLIKTCQKVTDRELVLHRQF